MLLRQTPLLDLIYDPTTDILRVNLPDFQDVEIPEIGQTLEQMKSLITAYFIPRMLIDGSVTTHMLSVDQLLHIWQQLLDSVSDTQLRKIARISSRNPAREALAEEVIRLIHPPGTYPQLQFEQFSTEEEAVKWLLEEDAKT